MLIYMFALCFAEDFLNMLVGNSDGQTLFMQGKLKMGGNMGLAMKLGQVLATKGPKSKLWAQDC